MDALYIIIGLFMMYATTHFFVIQFTKTWKQRTSYEMFLTIFTMVIFVLLFFIFVILFLKCGMNLWRDSLKTKGEMEYDRLKVKK